MHEKAEWLPALARHSRGDGGTMAESASDIDREFEARLADSSSMAIRVAFSVLRNQADAEDVAQEAFTKAHHAFHQLRDRDRFRAWLVRMTWRMALDHLRSGRRRMVRDMAAVPRAFGPTVEEAAIDDERRAQVWRAVDALPQRYRLVIVLSAMEGHSVRDVAALLGVAEGTVKSRLFKARKLLQEILR
jgi:RNA polymerase sigma-70 factor (ECF subfamily)